MFHCNTSTVLPRYGNQERLGCYPRPAIKREIETNDDCCTIPAKKGSIATALNEVHPVEQDPFVKRSSVIVCPCAREAQHQRFDLGENSYSG